MPIRYKTVKLKNSLDPAKPDMYIAVAKSSGELSLDQLSKLIANATTMSRSDIYGVLIALCDILPYELLEGKIVRLGNLGSFMLKLKSETANTPEEITFRKVKKLKLHFVPSKELKEELTKFELQKI